MALCPFTRKHLQCFSFLCYLFIILIFNAYFINHSNNKYLYLIIVIIIVLQIIKLCSPVNQAQQTYSYDLLLFYFFNCSGVEGLYSCIEMQMITHSLVSMFLSLLQS